jgi:hypothetical protein
MTERDGYLPGTCRDDDIGKDGFPINIVGKDRMDRFSLTTGGNDDSL